MFHWFFQRSWERSLEILGRCELCEVTHLHVWPYVFRKPPQIMEYLSGGFLLATGKGTGGAMEWNRAKDSEAIEAGGNELLSLQLLQRGLWVLEAMELGDWTSFTESASGRLMSGSALLSKVVHHLWWMFLLASPFGYCSKTDLVKSLGNKTLEFNSSVFQIG